MYRESEQNCVLCVVKVKSRVYRNKNRGGGLENKCIVKVSKNGYYLYTKKKVECLKNKREEVVRKINVW